MAAQRRFGIALLIAALSGCAANPYVSVPREPSPLPDRPQQGKSLAQSLRYADALYDAYENKLIEEYDRQRALSGGLLTLGALGVGLAASRAHADNLLGVALGGGLAYQLGTWNTNDGRLGLYLEGMKAINCAKAALVPLQLDESVLSRADQLQVEVGNQVKVAARAGGDVLSAMSEVARLRAAGSAVTALEANAQTELASLVTLLNDANTLAAQAAGQRLRVQGASHNFEQTIDRIRTTVDAALKGTLADISKLPDAIASFNRYASAVVPGVQLDASRNAAVAGLNKKVGPIAPPVTAQARSERSRLQAEDQDPSSALAQALGAMRAEQHYLAWLISRLRGAVEVSSAEQIKSRLDGCGVDAKVVSALSVTRATLNFVAGTAGVETVGVKGGTQPHAASWASLPHTGMSFTLTAGNVLVVAAGADAVAGQSHTLNVTDASGATAAIVITITAAVPAVTTKVVVLAANPTTAQSAESCLGSWRPAPEAVCFMQARIGTPVDGRFGSQSCRAYSAHGVASRQGSTPTPAGLADLVKEAGLPADASSTVLGAWLVRQRLTQCAGAQLPTLEKAEEIITAGASCAPKRAACPVEGAQCELECALSDTQLTRLRRQLNVAEGKGFDRPLRDALRAFGAGELPSNPEGRYTPAVANHPFQHSGIRSLEFT